MTDLTRWTTPEYYYGYNPVGDFLIGMRTRDSDILTISNFESVKERLLEAAKEFTDPNPRYDQYGHKEPSTTWIYTWTATCWAHGWREYLMIRSDAPEEILKVAEACTSALELYPIFDEDNYYIRQEAAIEDYWKHCSIKERVHCCQKAGTSIFAARHNWPENEVFEFLMDSGEFA